MTFVGEPRNIGRNRPITVGFQLSGDPVVDEMNAVPLAHFQFDRHFCLSTVIHPNKKIRKLKHFSRSGCCAHCLWGNSYSKSSDILPAQHPTLAPVKVWQREMIKEESNINMISRSWSQKRRCPTLSPTKIEGLKVENWPFSITPIKEGKDFLIASGVRVQLVLSQLHLGFNILNMWHSCCEMAERPKSWITFCCRPCSIRYPFDTAFTMYCTPGDGADMLAAWNATRQRHNHHINPCHVSHVIDLQENKRLHSLQTHCKHNSLQYLIWNQNCELIAFSCVDAKQVQRATVVQTSCWEQARFFSTSNSNNNHSSHQKSAMTSAQIWTWMEFLHQQDIFFKREVICLGFLVEKGIQLGK